MLTTVGSRSHNGIVPVTFYWTDRNGYCDECGLPAAFKLIGHRAYETDAWLLCSVCAANAAADGEFIERIEEN